MNEKEISSIAFKRMVKATITSDPSAFLGQGSRVQPWPQGRQMLKARSLIFPQWCISYFYSEIYIKNMASLDQAGIIKSFKSLPKALHLEGIPNSAQLWHQQFSSLLCLSAQVTEQVNSIFRTSFVLTGELKPFTKKALVLPLPASSPAKF